MDLWQTLTGSAHRKERIELLEVTRDHCEAKGDQAAAAHLNTLLLKHDRRRRTTGAEGGHADRD